MMHQVRWKNLNAVGNKTFATLEKKRLSQRNKKKLKETPVEQHVS